MDPCRPAIPLALEPDHEYVIVQADGQVRDHFNSTYSEDDKERIRLGYCCIQCGEAQYPNPPFPEECCVCRFPMRARQAQRFADEFRGTIRLGPSTSIDDELALAEELVAQERLRKEGLKRTRPGIIVPRWVDA